MQEKEGKNITLRFGNYLINFDHVLFIRFVSEQNHIEIGYDSGFTDIIGDTTTVRAIVRYMKMYPDLMNNDVYESMVKFAGGLRSKIKTDMMEKK